MAASIPTILAVLATSATVATQVENTKEKKKQSKVADRLANEKTALLNAQNAEREIDRKRRLRTALASQRALFGARGVSTKSGTSLAIATKAINESRAQASLNSKKNALQLNQIRGGGFSQTRAILGASQTLFSSYKK